MPRWIETVALIYTALLAARMDRECGRIIAPDVVMLYAMILNTFAPDSIEDACKRAREFVNHSYGLKRPDWYTSHVEKRSGIAGL